MSATLSILTGLWQNILMQRWIPFTIALIIGIALGLAYGWVISPVTYTDITPELLRADFRTDYVLMVAEAYRSEQDPEIATRKLAILGSEQPAVIAAQAYDYGHKNAYNADDLALIQELAVALKAFLWP